jgi:hypothetical protein
MEEFLNRLYLNPNEQKPIIKFSELTAFFLCASESFCRYNNQQFSHTDLDACGWLDAIGGVTSKKLGEMAVIAVSKLINVDPETLTSASTVKKETKATSAKKKH